MFLIPVIIIIGVVAASYALDIVKNFDIQLPKFNLGLTKTQEQGVQPQTQKSSSSTIKQAPSTRAPPAQQTQETKPAVSPYLNKIRISNFQKAEGAQPFRLTLYSNLSEDTPINITGWRVKGTFFGEFTIGKGIMKYHPVFFSQPIENILIRRSVIIYISGSQSPLGRGVNFRTNGCFGYLKQYTPLLPGTSSCSEDRPRIEEIKNLTPACQDFILNKINFSTCTIPDMGPVATNQECVSFINNPSTGYNYQGCYERRSNQNNFLSNEWYIYADTSLGHFLHDTITLYDQNGLAVDTYTY